jgi:hypothetical protein
LWKVFIEVKKLIVAKYSCSADAGPRLPAEHLREVFYRMGLDDKVCVIPEAGISPICLCVLELFIDPLECLCRKLLHSLEHIHLEDHGLTGVAGASQKQNIQYVFQGLSGWV